MGVDYVAGAEELLSLLDPGGNEWEMDDDVGALTAAQIQKVLATRPGGYAARPAPSPALSNQIIQTMAGLAAEVKNIRQNAQGRRVAMDAQAGRLPQIFLGVSTAGVTIAAGASLNITAETNTRLRVTDFFVDDAIAADFVIQDIQISRLSLFAGNQRIPASSFVTSVQRPPLEAPVLPPGTELSVNVTNRSGAARAFDSMFTGLDVGRTFDVTAR